MPRGTFLSNEEKAKIDVFRKCGLGLREISRNMGRSVSGTRNYVTLGHSYGNRPKRKGNIKVTRRTIGQIKEEATRNKLSASQIVSKLDLPINRRRVQQILHCSDNVKYKKSVKSSHLKKDINKLA